MIFKKYYFSNVSKLNNKQGDCKILFFVLSLLDISNKNII